MAHMTEDVEATTPETQADIGELARMLVEKKISPEKYFAAVDRRAQRLVATEAEAKR